MPPKISVIIPAYNCAKYISQALHSLQEQSISAWEAIVIDDGSTDNTADIVKKLATDDTRIHLLQQPASGKPAIARNTGLVVAKGEFICFLDADDYYASNKFEYCLNIAEKHPEAGLIFHDVHYVNEIKKILPNSYLERCHFKMKAATLLLPTITDVYQCTPELYFFISTANSSTLLPSSVFIQKKHMIEFSKELHVSEDLDLWLKLLSKNIPFIFIDKILAYYRRHSDNLTTYQPPIEKDRITVHKNNYLRSKKIFTKYQRIVYRNFIAQLYSNGGFCLMTLGKNREGFNAFLKSFLWHPNGFAVKSCIKIMGKTLINRLLNTI